MTKIASRAQRASPVRPTFGAPSCTGHTEPKHTGAAVALLRLILRGMRHRAVVILDPYVIPRIDPAVARFASEKMFDLTNASTIGALAEQRPARSRWFDMRDLVNSSAFTA